MIKKFYLLLMVCIVTLSTACDSGEIPLPHGTQEDNSLCPTVALGTEDICFRVPLSHYETLNWFQNILEKDGWSINWATDDEPIKVYLNKKGKKSELIFYKQSKDDLTGLLKRP
ncbi:hypothetical protein PA598K_04967 [Paenibacillus sp. 598K]|uniref:hypothetical protein n=1 Tax=Paenibacillus sp. 598K TaxID=1117987 RepID=UPI000FF9B5C7|nr:hypothetical protein [Paenibacillus sp. 598K]GBF76493.1 hypothetical protein PA598K_04967 [Paenibacillus sp. 598K]